MSSKQIVPEELGLPGMSDALGAMSSKALSGYAVKYIKIDLDSLSDVALLEEVETKAVHGDEIIILTKDKFTFMQQYFMVVSYLEKTE